MNQSSIINKFIERAGPLDPKPQYHYAQDSNNGRFGITTQVKEVFELWDNRFFKDYQRYPSPIKTQKPSEILPKLHIEYRGLSFDWDESDLMKAMRILQNAPFPKVSVIRSLDPLPIAFKRNDCDICILLAPTVIPLPKEDVEGLKAQVAHFKGNPWMMNKPTYYWNVQMPNCTFWLVEFPTHQGSFSASLYGYPIGRMLKCRSCMTELLINDWVANKTVRNHPECVCSCDTYGDECGCRRKREMAAYDRIRRESTIRKRFTKRSMM